MTHETENVDLLMLAARDAVARRLPYASWMGACIEAFQKAGGENLPANFITTKQLQRAASKGSPLDDSTTPREITCSGGYGA